jgi:NAD(P)-dependent dehydrogenase (short-subunit alcohol dehydrogenase family)
MKGPAMARLQNKIALISGGTSGIGAATAKLFRDEGAVVIATGSSQASIDKVRADLPGIELIASDAADTAAVKALIDQVKAKHGHIDVLFINAGIARFAPSSQIDEAFFDLQFNTNVRGPYFLLKHAAPVMADGGSIILTASVAGSTGGLPGASVYSATKAALRSFGRTFASELAPRRIRVNTISPGPVDTPIFLKNGYPQAAADAFLEDAKTRIPLGRAGQPDEVARAALYLAADASFTTGAELFVDGGLVDL